MSARPHLVLFAWVVLALAAGQPPAGAEDKDPIRDKLVAAKAAYDAETQLYKKQSVEWFDKREAAARNDGNKKLLDQIKDERKVYDEDDALPKSAPANLRQKPVNARKAMDAAYAEAVKAYTKAKKDDEAAAVEAAWKEFAAGNTVDLLALVDPKTHAVAGEWKREGKNLTAAKNGRLQLAYEPGEEYDIEVTVRRTGGDDGFCLGLVAGGRQVIAIVDSWPMRGHITGLESVDGKEVSDNATTVKGQFLKGDKSHTITGSVRAAKITIQVDGKSVIEFKGEFDRLSLPEGCAVPNKKALFLHIGPNTSFQIDRIVVKPVKGKGTIPK